MTAAPQEPRTAPAAPRQGEGEGETDFGFARVPLPEKQGRVRAVFDSVAPRYDLMNDLMSGGVHRLWKAQLLSWLAPRPGQRLIDVAGGTGDVALGFLGRTRGARAVVCDINAEMLKAGRARAPVAAAVGAGALDLVCGNAEALPFPSMSFDAYTIAFGIRNVTHIDKALAEARRVLKPGGRFLCLEFSEPQVPILDRAYDLYSFHVIPRLGSLVAGDAEAYRYLVESIRRFPNQRAFSARIAAAGLGQVKLRNLSGGIAALFSAWRV